MRILEAFSNDTGRLSWGRIGSFIALLSLIACLLLVWKYGKNKEMATFVDFAKDTTTKLAILIPSLYGSSKINDAFGKPGSITDNNINTEEK